MKSRSNLATALLLIAVGAWFLSIELSPTLKDFAYGRETWPMPIIGIGLFIAVLGVILWVPTMFIPACIVSGVGGLLAWQNATGNWGSWAYTWTLIPGFIGIGTFIAGLFSRQKNTVGEGGWMIFISLILFFIFGSFLGGLGIFGKYWPVLLIILGLTIFIQGLLRKK